MRAVLAFLLSGIAVTTFAQSWMPSEPGPVRTKASGNDITIENKAIRIHWNPAEANGLGGLSVRNLWTDESADVYSGYNVSNPFALTYKSPAGRRYFHGSKARLVKMPKGYSIVSDWGANPLSVHWQLVLRDGQNYARSIVTLKVGTADQDIEAITLIGGKMSATVVGTVPGSPIVTRSIFLGAEHPMAESKVENGLATSSILRKLPIKAGQSVTYSAVIGVAPPGQMRRAFLNYIERERPRPYKPFLHYNSWYDLGYFNRYTEAECLERIKTFGEELSVKRGVELSSFLFDDGWDNPNTVWEFTKDFSNGFVPMKFEAAKYKAAPGAWLSPWGGYGTPRKDRLAAGAKAGMEIDSQGYALSGPKYYDRFHQVTLDMVTKQGINQFKFDGTGSPDKQFPGSRFDSDFDAAIQLIKDLRAARPGLFVNLTTGTWPSPFWTRYADSIWRGGGDHDFAGVGPDRERWITYRDGDTYHGVVLKGPLYPLNSLMLHGLIYAQHAHSLSTDPTGAFRHEVRSYFGSGTQLQEMYITPSLLSRQNWDDIAESAKWSQANADVLRDTHWVGGDPLKGEVYGWAAWKPRKGFLTLRNPSDKAQAFFVDVRTVFELPIPQPSRGLWFVKDAWDPRGVGFWGVPGRGSVVLLDPFEVVTIQAIPGIYPAGIEPLPPDFSSDVPVRSQRPLSEGFQVLNVGMNAPIIPNSEAIRIFGPLDPLPDAQFTSKVLVVTIGKFAARMGSFGTAAAEWTELISHLEQLPGRPTLYFALASHMDIDEVLELPLLRQFARERRIPVINLASNTSESLTAAIADILVDRRADKKGWKLVSTDSEQPDEGPAKNAIDGDPNTYWHTRYDPTLDKQPHELVVDMDKAESIAGFRYLPRQDGGINGRVKGYRFFVSGPSPSSRPSDLAPDGTAWIEVASGEFPNTLEATKIKLKTPTTARYFKFVSLSEVNGQPYASAAEIDVVRN